MRALVMMLEALRLEMRAYALEHSIARTIQSGPISDELLEKSAAGLSDLRLDSDRKAAEALQIAAQLRTGPVG